MFVPRFTRLVSGLMFSMLLVASAVSPASAGAQVLFSFPGSTAVGATAGVQTVTVTVSKAGSLDSIKVRTMGNDGFDFGNAGFGSCNSGISYSPGQHCTVQVGFTPGAPGTRNGAIVLLDSSRAVLGTQMLSGLATGPLATFVPGTIHTVAGNDVWLYAGDGSAATASSLFLPFGIALDAAGDMFIADSTNQRIRMVDATSMLISTIAGNGGLGATGDGGPATLASVNNPTALVVDAMGNVFFSDNGNNTVRKIDVFDGTISTVAGVAGKHGYAGDSGPAAAALLHSPNGLALDAVGNLYIADTSNNVIRRVDAATGVISTIAGTGTASFTGDGGPAVLAALNGPWGISLSPTGVLYIADQYNARVRMVDAQGTMNTFAGSGVTGFNADGPALTAQLNVPAATAIDVAGNVYISDSGNNLVRKVNPQTGYLRTVAGGAGESISGDFGPATSAGVYGPYSLALDSQGNLYIADVFHNRIRKVSANASILGYPAIREGRVSAPQLQTLENDGNGTLVFSSLMAIANAQVDVPTTVCSSLSPMAPLEQCVFGADFAPTMVGNPVLGVIDINANSSNFPGVFSLIGQVLSVDPSAVTLTSGTNPSVTGSNILFSVVVTSSGTTPTGPVSLLDGTNILATGQLGPGGNVTFNVSTLASGQHMMTASYGGDTNNAKGTSSVLVQVVRDPVAATTTNIASSSNPVFAGAVLTLTAQVQAAVAGAGNGAITGSITFMYGSVLLGTAAVNNGAASVKVTTLPIGVDNIVASYGGNLSYGKSSSSALAEQVVIASTQTTLTSGLNPSSAGGSLTLTAAVTGTGGIPIGKVSFLDGSTPLGTAALSAQGIATLIVTGSGWTVGTHTLTAFYAGDGNDSSSLSPALSQVVNLATTSIRMSSTLNPSGLGAAVTFTASVSGSGGIPSGAVQFFDGTTALGGGTLNAQGQGSVSNSALVLGLHNITAVYGGDSFDSGSTSPILAQLVQAANIGATLTSSQNPSVFGTALTLTATVTGNGSAPTGSVSFVDGTTALGVVALGANGVATLSSSTLGIGSHSLVATYSGDVNHGLATSNLVNEVVIQGTTTTLSDSAPTSIAGTSLTFTATVKGAAGDPTPGTIALLDGTTLLSTLTPDASGIAALTTSLLAPGRHCLVASYSGDALDQPSSSSGVCETVTIATTAATLASSANPSYSGTPLILTASITGNGGAPTGNVSFLDAGVVLNTMPLPASGVASWTTSSLSPGIHALTTSYSGDTYDLPAVSAPLSQQIAEKTLISLVSSANPSLLGDNVDFTVTVSNGVSSAATGQVTLTDGGSAIGKAMLNPQGIAVFTVVMPGLGQHTIVASYGGDAQDVPASSQTLMQTVNLRPTTTSLTSSSTSLSLGQQIVLITVVQGAGSRPPTGSVTFASAKNVLGTAPIAASGLATLTLNPAQGVYAVIASYSGDSLFAASNSLPVGITVGPPVEFNINLQPPAVSMQSGAHGGLQISVATALTFTDTIAFGCAGLPASATCTFSTDKMKVGGGTTSTLSVIVDTGDPLGSGPTARLARPGRPAAGGGALACMLPAGALLALLLGKRRFRRAPGLLAMLLTLATVATLSGCGNTFNATDTPAGSYTFEIVGTGESTGATQSATVQLTVTK